MEQDKLATDELTNLPLDHSWYAKLANNFTIIQDALNENDWETIKSQVNDLEKEVNKFVKN